MRTCHTTQSNIHTQSHIETTSHTYIIHIIYTIHLHTQHTHHHNNRIKHTLCIQSLSHITVLTQQHTHQHIISINAYHTHTHHTQHTQHIKHNFEVTQHNNISRCYTVNSTYKSNVQAHNTLITH